MTDQHPSPRSSTLQVRSDERIANVEIRHWRCRTQGEVLQAWIRSGLWSRLDHRAKAFAGVALALAQETAGTWLLVELPPDVELRTMMGLGEGAPREGRKLLEATGVCRQSPWLRGRFYELHASADQVNRADEQPPLPFSDPRAGADRSTPARGFADEDPRLRADEPAPGSSNPRAGADRSTLARGSTDEDPRAGAGRAPSSSSIREEEKNAAAAGACDDAEEAHRELLAAIEEAGIEVQSPLGKHLLNDPDMTADLIRKRIRIDEPKGKGPVIVGRNALADARRLRHRREQAQQKAEANAELQRQQRQLEVGEAAAREAERQRQWSALPEPLLAIVDRLRERVGERAFSMYFNFPEMFRLIGSGKVLIVLAPNTLIVKKAHQHLAALQASIDGGEVRIKLASDTDANARRGTTPVGDPKGSSRD